MHPVHAAAQKKVSHAMKYPLTPFFFEEGEGGRDMSTVEVSASVFNEQNRSNNTLADPDTSTDICGNNRYRIETVDSHWTEDGEADIDYQGVYTKDIVIDTTTGLEFFGVRQIEIGDFALAWGPTPEHSQTATYRIKGDPDNGDEHSPYVWKEVTYSELVNPAYLTGKLADWKAESETFRFATDDGIREMDYLTESTDGLCRAQAGHYVFKSISPFSETLPDAGDSDADLWNGNYYVHARMVTRQLSPTLYTWDGGQLAYGMEIYNTGFSQTELTDEITENPWKDDYGIFEDDETILDSSPMLSALSLPVYDLYACSGDGKDHEVVFVSKTGAQLRLTMDVLEWDENVGEWGDWVVSSSEKVVTDPDSYRVAYTFPDGVSEWDNYGRVGVIERWDDVSEEWVVVADSEGGEFPSPESVISGDALGSSTLVLFYYRRREGSLWGFQEFKAPYTAMYRKKTFTKDLSVESVLAEGSCGGAVTGSFLLNVVEEYSDQTGLKLADDVTDFEMDINGTDWVVENYEDVSAELFGTTTVDTATTLRKDEDAAFSSNRFEVRMDSKRHTYTNWGGGKIISEEWVRIPATELIDGATFNTTGWNEIPSADAGECVTVEGIRLSEE